MLPPKSVPDQPRFLVVLTQLSMEVNLVCVGQASAKARVFQSALGDSLDSYNPAQQTLGSSEKHFPW
jgi:hypothetical protein